MSNLCINAISIFNEPNIKGTIKFHQCYNMKETYVIFNLYDLTPNKKRALHIHEYGDLTEGCKSLGSHWNPENKEHGSIYIDINNSHAGDMLNNITPDNNGVFKYEYIDKRINIFGNITNSIIGRSIVVHEGIDDLGQGLNKESKITGNAGGRMACSIIAHCKSGRLHK